MKRFAIVAGICASFVLGAGLTVYAQDEHHDENNGQPKQQEQAKPEEHQNQDKSNADRQSGDRRDTTPQKEGRQQEQTSGDRDHQDHAYQDRNQGAGHEVYNGGRQDQVHPQGQQDTHAERGGEAREGNQRRIADNDFRAHFGRDHRFAPHRMEVVEGRPRFSYGGYNFALVDAWPAGWSYDTDDCYVDYVDGNYYLMNVRHPGVRLLLTIL